MVTKPKSLKVFLCHASTDKPAVLALYHRFLEEGIDAWLDQKKLLPGQDWRVVIPEAVRESDVVVVCLSNRSITRAGYVQKEIEFALDIASEQPEGTIFLIPARLEECEVPARLRRWHWVDLFAEDGYENLMRSLRLRANKLGIPLESGPLINNEEDEQRWDQLYTEGVAALWMEEWDKACHRFHTILQERPNYKDTVVRLEYAKRQQHFSSLYSQAKEAQGNANWQAAVELLEKLTKEVASYKDATVLLKVAREKKEIVRLHQEAKKLHNAQQWEAVIRVFSQIAAIDPEYKDSEGLLSSAENKVAELLRLKELNNLYKQAIHAMDASEWHKALDLFQQILVNEPDFKESKRLVTKVEAEIKAADEKRLRKEQVTTLYEQARQSFRFRGWQETLIKIDEIRRLDPDFDDSDRLTLAANKELRNDEERIKLENQLREMYQTTVRSLRTKKYQESLEQWKEIIALDPAFSDSEKVEAIATKELDKLTKPRQGWSVAQVTVISFLAITVVSAGIFYLLSYVQGLNNTTVPVTATPYVSPIAANPNVWNFENDTEGWGSELTTNNVSIPSVENGNLTFEVNGANLYIVSPELEIDAAKTPIIYIRMRVPGNYSSGAISFITDTDSIWNKDKKHGFILKQSDGFYRYRVIMANEEKWKDTIIRLRLDLIGDSGGESNDVLIEIDYIVVKNQ